MTTLYGFFPVGTLTLPDALLCAFASRSCLQPCPDFQLSNTIDLNTHRATNEHGPRLNALGE